jgi:prepilin-type processing-associated H-X9-DG protein
MSVVTSVFTGIPAILLGMSGLHAIERSEGRLRGRRTAIWGVVLGSIGSSLVPVLLVSYVGYAYTTMKVNRARAAAAAQREQEQCVANLKRIGEAIESYVQKHGHYPPATFGDPRTGDGLSWRVAILPELGPEDAALYARFYLNEPWESPHNQTLRGEMPQVYRCPGHHNLAPHMTSYGVIITPESVFPGSYGKAAAIEVRPEDIKDGAANTLLVVESRSADTWTAPDYQHLNLLNVGGYHPNGYHALFADGSVRTLDVRLDPRRFAAMISRAGGEGP